MLPRTPVQPSLESLLAGYVRKQAEAAALGLSRGEGLEVTPYEAGPVQPIEPKVAWEEATAVLAFLGVPSIETSALKPPAGWSGLVAQTEPQVAIAFCLGNFPQLVRDFHRLLGPGDVSTFRPAADSASRALEPASLASWVERANGFPQVAVAAAICRLAGRCDLADRWDSVAAPAEWNSAWENERAARAWHRGQWDLAAAMWRSQSPSLPVRFNLAMASLFSGNTAAARPALEAVVADLPESSAWHHLARLYHTLSLLR